MQPEGEHAMRGPQPTILCDYDHARRLIQNGDVLLFSPRVRWWAVWDWWTLLIAIGTCWLRLSSEKRCWWVPHAGMAGWWGKTLMCIQETSIADHHERLSELVRAWPRKIHVFRPDWIDPDCFVHSPGTASRDRMVRIASRPYGWLNLLRVALHYVPVLWRVLPRDEDDLEESALPPYCSAAVSEALRTGGGLDPCPQTPDRLTTPRDLALSPRLVYLFTIDWIEPPCACASRGGDAERKAA
jgi:hypothetical protein